MALANLSWLHGKYWGVYNPFALVHLIATLIMLDFNQEVPYANHTTTLAL